MTHPFWFLLTVASVAWYAVLVLYVGFRGWKDIRRMTASLRHMSDGEPDRDKQ